MHHETKEAGMLDHTYSYTHAQLLRVVGKRGGGVVGQGGVGEDHPPDFDRSVNLSGETSCPYGGEK